MSEFAQPRRVKRNDARMSPDSLAMLAHIKDHPLSDFDTLYRLFSDASAKGLDRLRARLTYMTKTGHLTRGVVRGVTRWSLGDSIPPVRKSNAEVCLISVNVATCSVRVPAPSYDRMHGDPYLPPKDHCPRPAGLDYKRHASRGFSC